jgi:hypothetical protein
VIRAYAFRNREFAGKVVKQSTQAAVVLHLGSCCVVNGNHPAVQISPIGRLPLEWKPVVTRPGVIPFKPNHPFTFIKRAFRNRSCRAPHYRNECGARAPKHRA